MRLEERPGARRDPEAAGLYHFALLLPSRAALGRQLRHLLASGAPLTGAADHHVSEALYLDDPDGHGIELYRDRPRAEWLVDGRIHLTNSRLDRDGILAAGDGAGFAGLDPGTVMGHVHLQTCDVPAARDFYERRLGFDVTDGRLHVAFMSVAGYHHHVAVNDWEGKRRKAAPDAGGIGLLWYEIGVPPADHRRAGRRPARGRGRRRRAHRPRRRRHPDPLRCRLIALLGLRRLPFLS